MSDENDGSPQKKKSKIAKVPETAPPIAEITEGMILGYGNPLLDISANGTDEFLKKYELPDDSAILANDSHKAMYQDMIDTFKEVTYISGGATLNTMRVLQWFLGVPNATTFFGCIAKDQFGEILEEKAKEADVNAVFQYTEKEPTGTCGVIINGKKRSLCANLAAANCFTEEHLDVPENWALVEKANFFYVSSFTLTVCPSAVLRIAKHANETGKLFAMNLSAPFLITAFKDQMMKVFPYIDLLFGNEKEAEIFSKEHNLGTKDVMEIAMKIAAIPRENEERSLTVCITQGDQSTVVAKEGRVTLYPILPIDDESIVDTNGAGDAFAGGYLAQVLLGKTQKDSVRCGHYTANTIIQLSGCTFPDEGPDFE